jgi:hypothetical protein
MPRAPLDLDGATANELRALVERLACERDAARQQAAAESAARATAELRNGEIVKLCVALTHLNAAVTPDAVASALREIVINLIGSEEFAILEPARDGAPRAIASMGMDAHALAGLAARLVAAGPGSDAGLVARVPLRSGKQTVAELAIVAMLPHKGELDRFDLQLLEVLSTAGGAAIESARLRERLPHG